MLRRIAPALDMRVEIRLVPVKRKSVPARCADHVLRPRKPGCKAASREKRL